MTIDLMLFRIYKTFMYKSSNLNKNKRHKTKPFFLRFRHLFLDINNQGCNDTLSFFLYIFRNNTFESKVSKFYVLMQSVFLNDIYKYTFHEWYNKRKVNRIKSSIKCVCICIKGIQIWSHFT